MRREPPETNGCHHILIAHGVELNDEEYKKVNDYLAVQGTETQWFTWDEVKGDDFPAEIQDICKDISARV